METCPNCRDSLPTQSTTCGRCGFDLASRSLASSSPSSVSNPMPKSSPTPSTPPPDSMALTYALGRKVAKPATQHDNRIDQLAIRVPVEKQVPDVAARTPVPAAVGYAPAIPNPVAPCPSPTPSDEIQHPTVQPPEPEPASTTLDADKEVSSDTATPAPPLPPPRLLVLRGLKINAEYPIYEGRNVIGRFANQPVDIDLIAQESVEQVWCSRRHAIITCTKGNLVIEDLNSLNGTWVNGIRVHSGHHRALQPGDIIQIGTVQMKVLAG